MVKQLDFMVISLIKNLQHIYCINLSIIKFPAFLHTYWIRQGWVIKKHNGNVLHYFKNKNQNQLIKLSVNA